MFPKIIFFWGILWPYINSFWANFLDWDGTGFLWKQMYQKSVLYTEISSKLAMFDDSCSKYCSQFLYSGLGGPMIISSKTLMTGHRAMSLSLTSPLRGWLRQKSWQEPTRTQGKERVKKETPKGGCTGVLV